MRIFTFLLLFLLPVGVYAMGSKEKADAPVVAEAAQEPLAIVTAAGKRHDFMVEAVSAPADMAKGLMFRTEMPADQGMLFMFAGEGPRSFWMKNTFIPLDIIFIDADGKIRNIGKGVPQSLQTVKSDGDVLHVLELNAGTAEKLGFGPGDTVHHGAFGNALEQ